MRIVSLCPKSIQHLGMTPPVLNFWFEFASTYSYPAMMRITSLADAAGIALKFRPFLLGPVFKAQGWETSPFNLYVSKGRNMWRDLERLCEELK
ncbi:MAG: DsbA family protein, partial [Xanthobacteraceae bacterium]